MSSEYSIMSNRVTEAMNQPLTHKNSPCNEIKLA
jgi:hypothetical protein